MKKLLVVLLALVLVFSFAACGEQEETNTADEGLTAIPLGGNLPDVPLEGDAFGTYTEIDFPEGADLSNEDEAHLYASEGSDTPYIAVFRWANEDGKTLEEITAEEAEYYKASEYEMTSWEALGLDEGYFAMGEYGVDGNNYYYVECNIFQDGDDFVEIDFYCATEEVALGDTGQYVYVPAGYQDIMDDDQKEHGVVFYGEFDDSYDLPIIWIGKFEDSYEYLEWYWHNYCKDGIQFDAAQYKAWTDASAGGAWDEQTTKAYYEGVGCEYEKMSATDCGDGISAGAYYYIYNGDTECTEIYFAIGEDCYNFLLFGFGAHEYAAAAINSLHTK